MGLQSAMTTALTGLQAAETSIDVVGNNVANSNTVGFKESNTIFATQFLQTQSIGSAPSNSSGGTNPRQVGLGVKVAAITPNFSQGTIEISSNPLDVAIQGDGFLIVQGSQGEELFTRNGQLVLNSQNELTTTGGQRLRGYGVNDDFEIQVGPRVPLSIPLGQETVARATENATFAGVLNPSVDLGRNPSVSESIVFGDGTVERASGADFNLGDVLEADQPNVTPVTSSALGTGTGPDAGTVLYRMVFLDANGLESTPSAEVSVTNPAPGGEVTLSGLPTPSGAWVSSRLYRTEADGTTFHQLADIGTSTSYTDNSLDATIAAAPVLDADIIDPGSYSYFVTYYDPINSAETRPTDKIGARSLTSPGGRIRIDLTDLDPPADPRFTEVRIYRNSSDNSSVFRRIDTGANPIATGTTSFVDDVNDATLATRELINLDGPAAGEGNRLVDLVVRSGNAYVENFFQAGTLSFSAEKDGVATEPKTLEITGDPLNPGGPGTTFLELIEFMRDAMGIDTESSVPDAPFPTAGNVEITGDGRIRITSNLGEENAIEIPLTAFKLTPTGSLETQTPAISFSETQVADGPGASTEFIVYDSLGLPLSVRITTVLETKTPNSTTYRWYATSADNEQSDTNVTTVVGDGLLTFDSKGDLTSASQNRVSVQRNITASESPLEVELDFGLLKSLGIVDAQGEAVSSLNFTSQDGFPPGVLTDFIITEDGRIQGQFSNGTQRVLGQLVMARFANNGGLAQVGDSLFTTGVNSGEPSYGAPGENGAGSLTAGAVELSNTDIGQNLIELILASTQYRGGARVISAAQDLLDELLALRR